MYYSYGDAQKMRHMLKQSAEENGTSKEQMQHNTDSLNAMVSSCHALGSRSPSHSDNDVTVMLTVMLQTTPRETSADSAHQEPDNAQNNAVAVLIMDTAF